MQLPWNELVELPGYDAWKNDTEPPAQQPERDEDRDYEESRACDR